MPIYEYHCGECGEKFELFVRSANQETAPTCPKCKSQKVRKNVSLFGVGSKGASALSGTASCGPGPT